MSEERVLWVGKPSYRSLLPGVIFMTIIYIFGAIIIDIPLIGPFIAFMVYISLAVFLLGFSWVALQIRLASFKITTNYVVKVIGIRRQERKIPLTSISGITIQKPVMMWILGCAKIIILSHGASRITFPWIINYEMPRGILELKARRNP